MGTIIGDIAQIFFSRKTSHDFKRSSHLVWLTVKNINIKYCIH